MAVLRFWENWSNADVHVRQETEEKRALRDFRVHPCNLAGFRVTLS